MLIQINSICISKEYIAIASRPSLLFYSICIQIRIWLYQSQAPLTADWQNVVCTSVGDIFPDMTTAWRRIINMFLIQLDLTSSSPPFWREWWFVMSRRVGEQREKWSEVKYVGSFVRVPSASSYMETHLLILNACQLWNIRHKNLRRKYSTGNSESH